MNNYTYDKNIILPTKYLLIHFLVAFLCFNKIYPSPIFIFIINIPQEWSCETLITQIHCENE